MRTFAKSVGMLLLLAIGSAIAAAVGLLVYVKASGWGCEGGGYFEGCSSENDLLGKIAGWGTFVLVWTGVIAMMLRLGAGPETPQSTELPKEPEAAASDET